VNDVVVLSLNGSGDQSTQPFTVPSGKEWAIGYDYDCSNFGFRGNFDWTVKQGTNVDLSDLGPNALGMTGNNVEYYYDSGTFNLQVQSECNWAIKVQRAP
jgi:hypothetical protein